MSTVAEKAREEADRIEAEEREREAAEAADAEGATAEHGAENDGEPGEPDTTEPDAAPGDSPADPPAASDSAEPEAFNVDPKALEKELKRHEREMTKVFGPEWATMEPCVTCGGMGATPPGFEPPPEMIEDPDLLVCAACNGYGQRLTPSLHPSHLTAVCGPCVGAGYRLRAELEAEAEQQRIMAEMAAPAAPSGPQWDPIAGAYVPPVGAVPPPPSPRWNDALQRWEFPADDGGAGLGVVPYPPPQG